MQHAAQERCWPLDVRAGQECLSEYWPPAMSECFNVKRKGPPAPGESPVLIPIRLCTHLDPCCMLRDCSAVYALCLSLSASECVAACPRICRLMWNDSHGCTPPPPGTPWGPYVALGCQPPHIFTLIFTPPHQAHNGIFTLTPIFTVI